MKKVVKKEQEIGNDKKKDEVNRKNPAKWPTSSNHTDDYTLIHGTKHSKIQRVSSHIIKSKIQQTFSARNAF